MTTSTSDFVIVETHVESWPPMYYAILVVVGLLTLAGAIYWAISADD